METDICKATSAALLAQRQTLAEAAVADHYARHPELVERYGADGHDRCTADAVYHLSFLAQSVAAASPALFTDYVAWAKVLLAQLRIPAEDLAETLLSLQRVLRQHLHADAATIACQHVGAALQQLPTLPADVAPFVRAQNPLGPLAQDYLGALLRGDRQRARRLVMDAVLSSVSVKDIYLHVFQATQHEIGRLWQANKISVAQEHYCTGATQFIMASLYPYIFATERRDRRLVVACVAGDLHEIGARIVADCFEMDGWDTFYLGANTPTASLVDTVVQRHPHVLGLSVTMTFHLPAVTAVIDTVRAAQTCRDVRILVGGYPFNVVPDLWRKLGADGSATDGGAAVALANQLVDGGAGG